MKKFDCKIYYIPLEQIINNETSLVDHANKKLLYSDLSHLYEHIIFRDTNKEVEFIHQILQNKNPRSKTVLDLGCGVGRHLRELCKKGYKTTGIDLSEDMLNISKKNVPSGEFHKCDFRSFNLGKKFDAIISMWSTFNYLSNEHEVDRFFKNINNHLLTNGIFILDIYNYDNFNINCYYKEIDLNEYFIKQYVYKSLKGKYCEHLYFYIIYNKEEEGNTFVMDQEINIGYKKCEIVNSSMKYLTHLKSYGDYEFNDYNSKKSERLIMIFKKE